MAAAATTTSSSSLVVRGAQPKKLEMESTAISNHELTCIESDDMGEISSNGNESQKDDETKKGSQPSQKPIKFIDTTKNPHRIPSNDDCTMLLEGYFPKDEDVICSWARQNAS